MANVPFVGDNSEDGDLGSMLKLYKIDMDMYAENRGKVVALMRERVGGNEGMILLQGGPSTTRFDSDHEPIFRQESSFAYLFGVKEPDVFGVIDLASGESTLFFPKLPDSYAIHMGEVRSASSFQNEYKVDNVHFHDAMLEIITEMNPKVLYTSHGKNADSGKYSQEATFPGIEDFRVDNGVLYDALVDCRVIKSTKEIDLLKHINSISSEAHCWILSKACPGMYEFQLESMFRHWGYFRGGCRHQSYTGICGCGANGAVLHYGHEGAPNDCLIKDGSICLLDMGAEYKFYASDITCSFPIQGTFTESQKVIYQAVLAAQFGEMRAMKPGVSYIDMHTLSYRIICEELLKIGILHNGSIDEIMEANIGATFMPHGLGHFMGIDTHDVGGRPKGHPKQTRAGFAGLRCCLVLKAGMVLTVEPGIYFNDYALDLAIANPTQAKFINQKVLKLFRGFGGVRLEDDVVVTETGIENMTHCPRTIADVEAVMAGTKSYESTFTTYKD